MANSAGEKYVMFICGGKWQLPWLQFLKQKGHKVILADPYPTSVCVPYSDVYLQFDARDVEGILGEIQKRNYTIEFVTSDQTDVSTQTVAALSERLGTRANSTIAVDRFANKYLNREFVNREFGSHIPQFGKIENSSDLGQFVNKLGRDIIVKPADAQSSRGIHKIAFPPGEGLEAVLSDAFQHTRLPYVIAEEFVNGTEFTVEGICAAAKHYTLAISEKKHFRTGIASELRYPAVLPQKLQAELLAFHNSMIEKSGLEFGITHAEYIIDQDNGKFYLVEVACRGAGTLIPSDIVPWVSGVDLYEVFYQLIRGKEVLVNPNPVSKSAILYFFEFPSGIVQSIEGLDEAKAITGVHKLELEFAVGDVLKPAGDDRGRQGYCIVLADNNAALDVVLDKIRKTLNVKLEPLASTVA